MAPKPITIRFRRMKGKLGLAHLERREITLHPDQNEISLMGTAIHDRIQTIGNYIFDSPIYPG